MDKLKPEVREALRTLGNTCSSDCACVCIETRSPYVPTKCRLVGIIRDELHRLTAELEKAEAERDALRERIEGATRLKFYEAHAFGLALDDHSDIALVRIVPEQEGAS